MEISKGNNSHATCNDIQPPRLNLAPAVRRFDGQEEKYGGRSLSADFWENGGILFARIILFRQPSISP
jgi:hypothetical protein